MVIGPPRRVTRYWICSGAPEGDWIYSRDVHGTAYGGSSGSPVANSAGQVVGQHVCDTDIGGTVDEGCGGGGTCSDKGATCTSDSECCSNKCRGSQKWGMTCK